MLGDVCSSHPVELRELHSAGCDSDVLSSIDGHTRLWYRMIKEINLAQFQMDGGSSPPASSIPLPSSEGEYAKKSLHFGLQAPALDPEDSPVETWEDWVAQLVDELWGQLVNSKTLFPVTDMDTAWASRKQAEEVLKAAAGTGFDLPTPNKDWSGIDMTSDEALTHMVFSGVAAHHLVAVGSPYFAQFSDLTHSTAAANGAAYVVDFSFMADLPTREGFEAFGATAYFDGAGRPLQIYWCHGQQLVSPGEKDWEHAKFVWRSSVVLGLCPHSHQETLSVSVDISLSFMYLCWYVCTGVTAQDHLIGIHFTLSNFIIVNSRETLPTDHPLRRFLKPFSYRTFVINRAAMVRDLSYSPFSSHTFFVCLSLPLSLSPHPYLHPVSAAEPSMYPHGAFSSIPHDTHTHTHTHTCLEHSDYYV